jgi:5'(3')-deoxyribonucleotidase
MCQKKNNCYESTLKDKEPQNLEGLEAFEALSLATQLSANNLFVRKMDKKGIKA